MIGFDLDGTMDILVTKDWVKFPPVDQGVIISARPIEANDYVVKKLKNLRLPNYKFYPAPGDIIQESLRKAYWVKELELTNFYENEAEVYNRMIMILKSEESHCKLHHVTENTLYHWYL